LYFRYQQGVQAWARLLWARNYIEVYIEKLEIASWSPEGGRLFGRSDQIVEEGTCYINITPKLLDH
jgi:hypothetical protein